MPRKLIRDAGFDYLPNPTAEEVDFTMYQPTRGVCFYLGSTTEPYEVLIVYSMSDNRFQSFADAHLWGFCNEVMIANNVYLTVGYLSSPNGTRQVRLFCYNRFQMNKIMASILVKT